MSASSTRSACSSGVSVTTRDSRTAPNAISTVTAPASPAHAHTVRRAHVALDAAEEAVQPARLGARLRRVRVEVAIARPGRGAERSDEGVDVVHAIMVARNSAHGR